MNSQQLPDAIIAAFALTALLFTVYALLEVFGP